MNHNTINRQNVDQSIYKTSHKQKITKVHTDSNIHADTKESSINVEIGSE
ncbi:hypothetical protein BB561_001916 [Smittium simulii]|uniref:Uncharacterized protein n=1 Tax=Smittium simulii TaxID=133385 RepID=A0A2T9YSE3_9FUNG|nr:hypothetical protein BB561_001916 [Smittium simulii]